MSETLKMIVRELPRSMGELNHQLLYDDLKQALKEVEVLEQQLATARREGWEQCQREARGKLSARYERYLNSETIYILNEIECCERAIAAMEYKEKVND